MQILSPSLLSADFYCLRDELCALEDAGISHLHLDVMDGMFVPSISFGMPLIASLRSRTSLFFDVHMMVEEPIRYIEAMKESGADGITVQYEACRHLDRTLERIRHLGMKTGIALNPASGIHLLEDILPETDMVLIMGVNPGFGGQKLIPYTLDKVRRLFALRESRKLSFSIQLDGGVNRENIREIADAGVDNIVAGSAVFIGSVRENISTLEQALRG